MYIYQVINTVIVRVQPCEIKIEIGRGGESCSHQLRCDGSQQRLRLESWLRMLLEKKSNTLTFHFVCRGHAFDVLLYDMIDRVDMK